MPKVDVAGLKIDALAKAELLEQLARRLAERRKTFVTTPYSEFLYAGLRDSAVLAILNQADYAVADGIAILWAAYYLPLPLLGRPKWLRAWQAGWQIFSSGGAILFRPASLKTVIPEKIVGADLFWDIAQLAAQNNFSIYLLGGFGQTPQLVAEKLAVRFPQIKIVGVSAKNPDDASVLADVTTAAPDILLVAYGPIRQERWIVKHWPSLPGYLVIGLGGTFDYVAGARRAPHQAIRQNGLEWLYRLLTQPHRAGRIFRATVGLAAALWRYKVRQIGPLSQA